MIHTDEHSASKISTQDDFDMRPGPRSQRADAHASDDLSPWQKGLPRHIEGGFTAVAEELDRRSRDWSLMVRLLSQQRLQLETAEDERHRLYLELEAVLPEVRSTATELADRVAMTKSGDVSGNLSALFTENLRELDKLENIAQALTANLLWIRSSWEQYARSVIGAEKMRTDPKG